MKRISIDLRIGPLRLALLALARAHASEHVLNPRSAVKEVKSAAALLDLSDLGNQKRPSTRSPLIPAYKTRINGALLIQFGCPACNGIHSHGLSEPSAVPLQHRVSHCDLDFGQSRGYRLLIFGWKHGDDLPVCSSAEIDALNAAICESAQ